MVKAYIFVKCKHTDLKRIRQQILEIPEIKEAYILKESFDLVCTLECESNRQLKPIVTSKIRVIPEIIETMTIICV